MRILVPLFSLGIMDKPNPYTDESLNVRSEAHTELSRNIAAAAHILLKNDGILPLPIPIPPLSSSHTNANTNTDAPIKIAMIGQAARAPIVAGGGSGAVYSKYTVTPYHAIMKAFNIVDEYPVKTSPSCNSSSSFVQNMGFDQSGCQSVPSVSVQDCSSQCTSDLNCNYFAFSANRLVGLRHHYLLVPLLLFFFYYSLFIVYYLYYSLYHLYHCLSLSIKVPVLSY